MWWGRQGVSSSCVFLHTFCTHHNISQQIYDHTQWYDTGGSRPFAISSGTGDFAMLPRSYLLLLEPDIHNHGLQLWSDFDLSEFHEFCDLRIFNIFTLFEEYVCVCAHLHTNDPALCISQWCAFSRDVWSLLEPFRLRDTIFACVRSVEWRTRPLAALQLWVFGCFQNMSNVCS